LRKINWGVIGLGNIALDFAENFKKITNAQLIGIASKDANKIKMFQERFEIDKDLSFQNYEDLLDCKLVDAIYIALPNSYHYKWIMKCIEKKKGILVEKPAVLSFNEIENIDKELQGKNLLFVEAFMYRYHPQIKKTIELIKKGKIGNLTSMESMFGGDILTKRNIFGLKKNKKIDIKNRLFNKDLGGGSILDLGCYPASLALLIAALIPDINVSNIKLINKKNDIGSTGVDIEGIIELDFDSKFKCKLSSSFKNDLGRETRIFGDKGSLRIQDSWFGKPAQITVEGDNNYIEEMNSNENVYALQIEEVSNAMIKDKKKIGYPGMTINETLLNMKILDMWKD